MITHCHIGCYAVVIRDGRILLCTKTRGPYTGSLDLPGGAIEVGEEPLEALARELREETGLRIADASLLSVRTTRTQYRRGDGAEELMLHVGLLFTVNAEGELVEPTADGDVASATWLPLHDASDPLTPFARAAIALLSTPTPPANPQAPFQWPRSIEWDIIEDGSGDGR